MSTAQRVLDIVRSKIEANADGIDKLRDLSSVTVIVQLDRFGPGRDHVVVRTEAARPT